MNPRQEERIESLHKRLYELGLPRQKAASAAFCREMALLAILIHCRITARKSG
jgi:hypothetical protein